MAYQIVDDGASIRVVGDQGEVLLLKRSIQRISVINGDQIEINTGDPLQNIFFRYSEVSAPRVASVLLLRDFMNGLIT